MLRVPDSSRVDHGSRQTSKTEPDLEAALLNLMPHWHREELGAFEYLSGGYSNENYRLDRSGERYVLRLPSRNRPFVDRAHEEAFYQSDHRVRVPEVIAFDRTTGNMLTRFEAGALLSSAAVEIDAMVDYLQQLHVSLPDSGRRYDPVVLARRFLEEGQPPVWIRELANRLSWNPTVCVPCHNDLNPWNVIVPATGQWVTLDWEWYGDNDPLFDLVTLHQGLMLNDHGLHDMAERWARGPVAMARLQHCICAFWLREYAWAHAELAHGNARSEIVLQLETAALRLQPFR